MAAWAAYAAAQRRPAFGVLAGAAVVAAWFTKASAAFFLPALAGDCAITLALAWSPAIRRRLGAGQSGGTAFRLDGDDERRVVLAVHVQAHGMRSDAADRRVQTDVLVVDLATGRAQQRAHGRRIDRAVQVAVLVGLHRRRELQAFEERDALGDLGAARGLLDVEPLSPARHRALVVVGGLDGEAPRHEEVARVAGTDAHDVAAPA